MRGPRSELRVELPATLEAIESFCLQFQNWRGIACAELDAFSSELLLREVLTNSVVHGSAEDPRQHISCLLRAKRGRLIIAIRNGGKGFDWRAIWDRHADSWDTHGRGIEILRHYASAVRFNLSGNSVTLVKRF
jgi:anti-sigma regulatory factor (Ser/Thr protein kinase)